MDNKQYRKSFSYYRRKPITQLLPSFFFLYLWSFPDNTVKFTFYFLYVWSRTRHFYSPFLRLPSDNSLFVVLNR